MRAYYCDSSALIKQYTNETGSLWVRGLTDPKAGNGIYRYASPRGRMRSTARVCVAVS
jgi:hypothetical protein